MPGPKPESIELTETQESILEQLVRREKSCQQLARRNQIILAASQDTANEQIAHRLGLTCNMVRTWRIRWAESAGTIAVCAAEEKEKEHRHRIVNHPLDAEGIS